MAIVSRLQLNHPTLGTAGGAGLHSSIESLYTKIGDNMADRWFAITDFDQTEVVDLLHNFETDINNLRYDLFNYTGGEWVRLTAATSPARSAFSVIEKVGSEDTTLQITNNTGGNDLTFAVGITFDSISLADSDIKDVDIVTTPPEDGQSLVWDSASSKFKPGASGDSSFKLQGVTDPNLTLKGGYFLLDDGREIATYDGAGTATTDFGTDIVVNLDTVLGTNPVNATTYYLYLNLLALGSEVTIDNGRKVYSVAAADTSKFYLSTTKPEAIKKTQYAVLGFIKSATTGTVWSGSGAAFGTVASKKYNQRQVDGVNYLFDFYNANALGTVGTALVGDTDTRNTNNFLSWQSTNTANISLVESTTSPLRSPNNYLFTGSGAAANGTTFVESPAFQLHVADLGKPIMVSFDLADVTADGNFDVIMVRYNSSGAYQDKISIAGNASGANQPSAKLPTGIAKFNGFFIASSTSTDYYALRFRRLAGTDVPRLDSIKVSPDTVIQGAAVTDWVSYTPTWANTTGGTSTGKWRRIGDSMEVMMSLEDLTSVTGDITASIPSSYTIDTTKLPETANMVLGESLANDANGSYWSGTVHYSTTSLVQFVSANFAYVWRATVPFTFASGDDLKAHFTVPIVGWSSSVTMANRSVEEYASNTGAEGVTAGQTYSNTSYLAYGSAGSAFVSVASTTADNATNYLVRFQTPIQPTDLLTLEVTDPQGGWVPLGQVDSSPVSYQNQADSYYGVGFERVSGSSTDIYVAFGNKGCRPLTTNGTAYAASGGAWSTLTARKWRVRKVSGGASVGFPVSARNIVGDVSGTAVPSGYIGELIEATVSTATNAAATGVPLPLASITLLAGTWDISATATLLKNSSTPNGVVEMAVGTTSASVAGAVDGYDYLVGDPPAIIATAQMTIAMPRKRVRITSSTTYYLNVATAYSAGTPKWRGYLSAVRIA